MSIINILDPSLANKIAAGEVIERPASVVKELVENSIDAGATVIEIKVKEAGKKLISVSDKGKGMDKEDACLAFQRHATSKIIKERDLFNIHTLGFRGEALPSISSVSEVTIETSTGGVGTKLKVVDSKIVEESTCASRKGTTIRAENLFYNTPARLKYLKSDNVELAHISEVVSKIALSHPSVSLTLYVEDKVNFYSTGRGDVLEVISSLYGLNVAREMKKFKGETDDFNISGYTSSLGVSKANRNFIITILNGRCVKMLGVQSSVIDAYKTYLSDDRFPITIINIEVDPTLVDVNVHPSKHEVRLSKERELKDLVEETIREIFKVNNIAPRIYSEPAKKEEQIKLDVDTFYNQSANFSYNEEIQINENLVKEEIKELEEVIDYANKESEDKKYIRLTPLAQHHGKYILAYDDEAMYIVDQHAAAERINYEKFLRRMNDQNNWVYTDLLVPIVVNVSNVQATKLLDYIDSFKNIGIEMSPFGINAFRVTSIPVWMKESNVNEYIDEIIEQVLSSSGKVKLGDLRLKAISTLACKASLKANKNLTMEEMKVLLDNLFTCNNPFTCPHGRPVLIVYSDYELDKMFKRII